jgi:hypothetical protein
VLHDERFGLERAANLAKWERMGFVIQKIWLLHSSTQNPHTPNQLQKFDYLDFLILDPRYDVRLLGYI